MSLYFRCTAVYLLCVSTLVGAELTEPTQSPQWQAASPSRKVASLNGPWSLSTDEERRIVEVPGTFENQLAPDFDGRATYRVEVKPLEIPEGHRLLVEFHGAATSATVKFDEKLLGTHVGGWTPFRWDATRAIDRSTVPWKLEVELDELVGHHTQGFLPIVAPHFGGLWQDVRLLVVPAVWIDDFELRAIGNCETNRLELSVPVEIPRDDVDNARIVVEVRGPDAREWTKVADEAMTDRAIDREGQQVATEGNGTFRFVQQISAKVAENSDAVPRRWTPGDPSLYDVRVTVNSRDAVDVVQTRCGFRSVAARGDRFLLNAEPLSIRGILNWGYAPPRTAPTLDEQRMRSEIELAKSYGFNLMKFCLWIPPKRYLELCDELGMLAWIEYPTWHAQLTPSNLSELQREYHEFFAYDRNHPCVVLRSLTCETGPSADLGVIQSLYDLAKKEIPGAVVEDDSSWIEWNRVNDFYDDHPYGNNHTWPRTLERLTNYIAQHDAKPLVLGEAIAADTWTDPASFASFPTTADGEEPFYWPMHLRDNARWMKAFGVPNSHGLLHSSRHYALLMRKYQIETYRRMVPHGGYVVSVIRDFPLASMGLVDYHDQPKWSHQQWGFHGETMILLHTENDRRSFHANEEIVLPLAISAQGSKDLHNATLHVALRDESALATERANDHRPEGQSFDLGTLRAGELSEWISCRFAGRAVRKPTRLVLEAELVTEATRQHNAWPIWIFPDVAGPLPVIARHGSWPDEFMKKELEACSMELAEGSDSTETGGGILVARRFDRELLDRLEAGCRVFMVPDGEPGSFAREEHWFLRGGPVVGEGAERVGLVSRAVAAEAPHGGDRDEANWFVELQHFDLGGPVIPRIDAMLPTIEPWFALWDNHDRPETRTHGLLFALPVGKGRVIVSTLNHEGTTNAAGQWLMAKSLRNLLEPTKPGSAAPSERGDHNLVKLRSEVDRYRLELRDRTWAFRPDPEQRGNERAWHTTDFDDGQWPRIRADRAWDGQGYESLDGWAWYRLQVELPQELRTASHVYLNFTGVDDHYIAYVDGQPMGSGGDIATKRTAFEDRTSHDITTAARGKSSIQLAVAVYDWYGAGGIFRPVSLSTAPLDNDAPWLK